MGKRFRCPEDWSKQQLYKAWQEQIQSGQRQVEMKNAAIAERDALKDELAHSKKVVRFLWGAVEAMSKAIMAMPAKGETSDAHRP